MSRSTDAERAETAKRWMARPIPACCTTEETIFDPSAQVGKAMGGREFFFNIGAKFIHRIGLMRGMGWELPFGEARDGIDYVCISVRPGGGGVYDMLFGRRTDKREGIDVYAGLENPFGIETIRTVEKVALGDLRATYDRETING